MASRGRSVPVAAADEALQRLAVSMVGQENAAASLPLARSILSSSLGNRPDSRSAESTWRRAERFLSDEGFSELRRLHQELAGEDMRLADGLANVLSQMASDEPAVSDTQPTGARQTSSMSRSSRSDAQHIPEPMDISNLDLSQIALKLRSEELRLLRDCRFALQGLDGERIRLSQDDVHIHPSSRRLLLESCHPVLKSQLGAGAYDALQQCCQAGLLYRSVHHYIQIVADSSVQHKGSVAQALAGALTREIQHFHEHLASPKIASCESLRQLLINMQQPTRRLKTLAMLTDGIKDLSGGHLLSALYKHSAHGDSRHRSLVEDLLSAASRPWFHILFLFTTRGELVDPHKEFFVELSAIGENAIHWHDRYFFRREKLPLGILDENLAENCLSLGRSINFIRTTLQETDWGLDLLSKSEGEGNLSNVSVENDDDCRVSMGYSYQPPCHGAPNGSRLHNTLARVADQVHSHILKSLREDHHLMEHLWALKQFLLLGQGDFFSALMDGLHTEFEGRRGLAGIYKHSLMSHVESALVSTNARGLPSYVLGRLSVDLTWEENEDARYQFAQPRDTKAHPGDRSGWDIFMLSYDVPATLRFIVHPSSMKRYKAVFLLLFRLKQVEFTLNLTWRQSTALQHALQTFAQHNAINVLSNSGYSLALVLLREISITRQSMMHFTGNLKSYFMFEVLEAGWKELVAQIEGARTIDQVIVAHDSYLENIFRKSLLGDPSAVDEADDPLPARLERLLTLAGEFCKLQDSYFQQALDAAERSGQRRKEAEKRAELGQWGFNSERELQEEESFFGLTDAVKLDKVHQIANEFREKMVELLDRLDQIVNCPRSTTSADIESMMSPSTPMMTPRHGSLSLRQLDNDSLRFLAFQLDYRDFYKTSGL